MFQFFTNYPIGYYARSLFAPKGKGPDSAFYFGPDKNMLLVRGKSNEGILHFEPNLKTYIGSPSLGIVTKAEGELINPHVPSSFRKELSLPLRLHQDNICHLVVEDHDAHISVLNSDNHPNVRDLKTALMEDASTLIPLWSSYNLKGDYTWEILDMSWRKMENEDKTPPKVVAVGYPEEKVLAMCQWSKLFGNHLLNILPSQVAVLRMIREQEERREQVEQEAEKKGETKEKPPLEESQEITGRIDPPPGTYLVVYSGVHEHSISFFSRFECAVYSPQRSREGLNTADALQEILDIYEESTFNRRLPIHIWGLPPDNYMIEGLLEEGFKTLRVWEPDQLMGEMPIILERNPEKKPILTAEAWLLKSLFID
jgi:hypothetical protein